VEVDGAQLSNPLNVLQRFPGTGVSTTGGSYTKSETGRGLAGGVRSSAIKPKRDDIISYLNTSKGRDTARDAMNSILEVDILGKIAKDILISTYTREVNSSYPVTSKYPDSCWSLNTDAILQETTIYCK